VCSYFVDAGLLVEALVILHTKTRYTLYIILISHPIYMSKISVSMDEVNSAEANT